MSLIKAKAMAMVNDSAALIISIRKNRQEKITEILMLIEQAETWNKISFLPFFHLLTQRINTKKLA